MWETWQEAERGRAWLREQHSDCGDEDQANRLAMMHYGLGCVMEIASLYNDAMNEPPRANGPSADELFSVCRERIEQRYLPPLDPTESNQNADPLRLYFPVGQRREHRTAMIRDAWKNSCEHRLFRSRGEFARFASERVHVTPRWIMKCIQSGSEQQL
jgi:hypothetical protein